MKHNISISFILILITGILSRLPAQVNIAGAESETLIFSAIGQYPSRPDTLRIALPENVTAISKVRFSMVGAEHFRVVSDLPAYPEAGGWAEILFSFNGNNAVGVHRATCGLFDQNDKELARVSLRGLCSPALEGENEPPLAAVLETLGYPIDLGWSSLPNHVRPELQGEELPPCSFRAADGKEVIMEPIARYSPDFALPFGYYPATSESPELREVGVLAAAGAFPEHQTLFPRLVSGGTAFHPGDGAFGLYTTSPSHTAYSDDHWNEKYHPDHAAHAVRAYPLRNGEGKIIPHAYLICFEEARNGDYQDYVFVLRNVEVVEK